ncbi:uncharacterized protein TOT_020000241 [Theileria orientalis strain Shintoku]|uniref:SP-RING-type domain-containing protein n=1 Tax=Theileria orientalis strain Shintoku TaxID=869250 RepID=J4DP26_THEOR|nr:uncharacterized protein TOT_020000241 [Theileria orientalis strain Shintoku]BAM39974.1 uncharacterized protein TOT_020000241 [Theileria orientalis strain Shintoku]|eukprot:XP_009690275.1 uncharacterized protein TOT_020000241 [Theileria orientalis strain Shintoku]
MVRKSSRVPVVNEFYYCVCAGSFVVKDQDSKPLVCKTCGKSSHRECARFSGNEEDFECVLCKVHTLDPFNAVEDFLWYDCIGNTSTYFVVDAVNLRKWRSNNKDVYMACIPLNKERLQHEWPKTFQLKINNDMVHIVKEPSWEHKRRDNPIKITHAMRTGENLVNISSTTYNDNEPLFLLIIFLSKQVTVDTILNNVKKNQCVPYDDARSRVHTILNTEIGDDEIVCMDSTHKLDFSCPVTLDKIEVPTRGKFCRHIQCYDLSGYLKVMERTSAFNMRWRCPECQLIVKPHDLVVDTFVEKLMKDLPNANTIELDKELNYRIIVDANALRASTLPQSEEDLKERVAEAAAELNLSEDEAAVKASEAVIELVESDDHCEVICISDDEAGAQPPTPRKNGRLRKSAPQSDKDAESEGTTDTKRRRRKLRKPVESVPSFYPLIEDSALADCVKTFNQRNLNAFSKTTPSYEAFILNPPLVDEDPEHFVNSILDGLGDKQM